MINVPEYIYRDVAIEVPKYVDVPRDVYYDKIIEVPKERIVEKEIVVDRIVEKPYTVEKIVEKKKEVPVEKIVEVPVYFDKIVEVPVEKRVEVPFRVEKHVKKIVPKQVNVPLISTKDVEVPFERIIDEPYEVIEEVPYPVEKVVEKIVDVPVYTEEQVYDYIEIEVPYEKIVEVPVYQDKEITVEIIREKFVEVPYEKVIDKVVEVEKIIEKPIYNQKIVEKPVQKIVEKRVEVPIEKYVEIPKYREVQKRIRVEHKAQKSSVVEKKNTRSMRKSVRTSTISTSQKNAYTSLGEALSKYKIENLKLSLDIKTLQQQTAEYRKVAQNPEYFRRENEELKIKIQNLEKSIVNIKSENVHLEQTTILSKETQLIDAYSSSDIAKLENEVRNLTDKNQKLRDVLNGLGSSTAVTNTAYIQRSINEGSKVSNVQSSQNWTSTTQYTTTNQYQNVVEQPKISTTNTTTEVRTSTSKVAPTRISYGTTSGVTTSQLTGQIIGQTTGLTTGLTGTRVSYGNDRVSQSGVRVASTERKEVTNTYTAPKETAKTYTTTTETQVVSNQPMKTIWQADYQQAKPLESTVSYGGRKSQTQTIIGQPQITTSTTQGTTTYTSTAPKTTVQTFAPQITTSTYPLANSQVYTTGTSTKIVEPTKIVNANRIVESSSRGLFEQVKSGNYVTESKVSRVVTSEGTTNTGFKTVTNYSNNPYLNAYVDGTKKY